MAGIPIEEGLFTWPSSNPTLIGCQCDNCGCVEFPKRKYCPQCGSSNVKTKQLATQGTLWSWTVQSFEPKAPYISSKPSQPFEPFGVGYVELPNQVCVESPLVECDLDQLTIGMPLELVIVPHHQSETGEDVMAFAFRPKKNGGD